MNNINEILKPKSRFNIFKTKSIQTLNRMKDIYWYYIAMYVLGELNILIINKDFTFETQIIFLFVFLCAMIFTFIFNYLFYKQISKLTD